MILKNVRIAYPHLFEPYAYQNGPNKKYEITLMIPKSDTKTMEDIKKALAAAKARKWPAGAGKEVQSPVKDGDEMSTDAFKDHWIIRAKAGKPDGSGRPGVVLPNLKPAAADDIVSGDFCNVDINAYGYDQSGNKGLSFGLNNVQLAMKGDRIGSGKARPESVFEAMEMAGSPSTGETAEDDFF
jgi:hypothetical protein